MQRISWIHPSYRDLMIDELTNNSSTRIRFLKEMSIRGIKLAISDTGGPDGERKFPFMVDEETWEIFKKRCLELADTGSPSEQQVLITTLTDASQNAIGRQKEIILSTLSEVLNLVKNYWNKNNLIISSYDLSVYIKASLLVHPLPPMPNLDFSWKTKYEATSKALDEYEEGDEFFVGYLRLSEWVDFLHEINFGEPRFLRQVDFPNHYLSKIQQFADIIKFELGVIILSHKEFTEHIDKLEKIVDILSILIPFLPYKYKFITSLKHAVEKEIEDLKLKEGDISNEDFDEDYDGLSEYEDDFSIDELFIDL